MDHFDTSDAPLSEARRAAARARATMGESASAAGVDWQRYEPLVRDRILVRALKDKPRLYGGLGQSRFGGSADLPSPAACPQAPGFDFVFLCQLDLADVARLDVEGLLPPSGLLSFFVGTPAVMGLHTEYEVEGRVLYHPADAALEPFVRSWGAPRQRGMAFELSPAPPPWDSAFVGYEDRAYRDWYDVWQGRGEGSTRTALLGFDRVYESVLQPREVMLLSCWSHEDIDYRFVEAVTLSFAIDRAALRARSWSAVRCWEGCSL